MKFIIKDEIFQKFPALRIGVVVGRGLSIQRQSPGLQDVIRENTAKLIETTGDKKLSDFNNISAWRETYRAFGVNPKRHKPTAEAFLKRISKGQPFPDINTAVDAYLAVELLTMLPIGGYDLAAVQGDILLRISPGEEEFLPIGASGVECTVPGEIIYADSKKVLTRNWNYRDSHHTKITLETTDILLACEAAQKTVDTRDLELTMDKIVEYESAFCKGEYTVFFLDKEHPHITFLVPACPVRR